MGGEQLEAGLPDPMIALRTTIAGFSEHQLARRAEHLRGEIQGIQETINDLVAKRDSLRTQHDIIVNRWVEIHGVDDTLL